MHARPPPRPQQVQSARKGIAWQRTKWWIETAAAVAPLTTEALLHSFVTSSDSWPGATAPAWLPEEGAGVPRLGACTPMRVA